MVLQKRPYSQSWKKDVLWFLFVSFSCKKYLHMWVLNIVWHRTGACCYSQRNTKHSWLALCSHTSQFLVYMPGIVRIPSTTSLANLWMQENQHVAHYHPNSCCHLIKDIQFHSGPDSWDWLLFAMSHPPFPSLSFLPDVGVRSAPYWLVHWKLWRPVCSHPPSPSMCLRSSLVLSTEPVWRACPRLAPCISSSGYSATFLTVRPTCLT